LSLPNIRKVEPFVAIFFVLITVSVLLLTSDEVELGRTISLLGLIFFVIGVLSISLERILSGEIQNEPNDF